MERTSAILNSVENLITKRSAKTRAVGEQPEYRFVGEIMVGENRVRMHYQLAGLPRGNAKQMLDLPYFTVTFEQLEHIEREAPKGLKRSTFCITREGAQTVDLEWT
ncbi:MAG: hypothetical protein WEB52_01085 [Dehalococcoidia bacterium]